jgi:hypothetical protein
MKLKKIKIFVGLSIIILIISSCSPKVASVRYDVVDSEMMNKSLGQDIAVGILNIPDRRHDSEGKEKLIGSVYGGFKNVIRRIYSEQPINLDVIDAFGNLFSANGFHVMKYPGVTDCDELSAERLCIKGYINKFWTESYYKVGAEVDIDAEIYDRKLNEVIWSGKIKGIQKKGMGGGVFANTDKMVLFLNEVFSDAIKTAWTTQGMREALERLTR